MSGPAWSTRENDGDRRLFLTEEADAFYVEIEEAGGGWAARQGLVGSAVARLSPEAALSLAEWLLERVKCDEGDECYTCGVRLCNCARYEEQQR
jgi:hypothetical protein